MRIRQVLVCFFLITQAEVMTSPFHENIGVRRETRGGDITVGCTFQLSGRRKIFCRNDCTNGNILVETTGVLNQTGRYRIEYKESPTVIYVSITNLTMTDSEQYKCGLGRNWFPDSTVTFELIVEDKTTTTSKPTLTPRPSATKSTPSTSTLSTRMSLSSTTGSSSTTNLSHFPRTNPTLASGQDQFHSDTSHLPPTESPNKDLSLYLGLTLLLLVLILSAVLFIFCRKRNRKPKGPPARTEYDDIHNVNRVYEEIKEDRQNRPPPSNVSTVYATANFVIPNDTETTDEYSLITMAASQNRTGNDSGNLTYSEVDFSKSQRASPNSAPCGEADKVIYSEPRVRKDSDDRKTPLYSTVSLH